MSARRRLAAGTALLLAVTAAAGGLAWWAIVKRGGERAAAEARSKKILPFDPDEAVALRVRAKGDDARLERRDGRWRLVSPVAADADPREVGAVLSALAALERRATSAAAAPSADRLASYGLDAPAARFDLELSGGRTLSLVVGETSGFDTTMFVSPASGEILVADGRGRIDLEKSAFELRERRLLRFEPGEVAELELVGSRGPLSLVREGGAWRLAAPVKEPADAAAAEGLVAALRELRATAFEEGAPPAGKPAVAVRVKLAGGAEQRLLAWSAGGGDALAVQVSTETERARLAASALPTLDPDPMTLRDRRVVVVDREQVAAVRVEEAGGGFAMARRPGGTGQPDTWSLTAPEARPLDPWKSQSLVWTLAGLKGERILDGAASAGKVRRTYVLLDAAGAELARLALGDERGEEVLVKGGARVLAVPRDRLAGLPAGPADLAPAGVAPPDGVTKPASGG